MGRKFSTHGDYEKWRGTDLWFENCTGETAKKTGQGGGYFEIGLTEVGHDSADWTELAVNRIP